jgi:hypothetical protein
MRNGWWRCIVCLAVCCAPLGSAEPAADSKAGPLLTRIKAVRKEGAGNRDAARAWKDLVALGPDALPATLAALDDADPVAANWLRTAVDAIAERERETGRPLPAARLEAFVRDQQHAGPARRLAYEWLVTADPTAPSRLLPGMLHDPSTELRRDAVAVAMKEAQTLLDRGDKAAATAAYHKAFAGALDRDQVDDIAGRLKSLGVKVDLAAHFGFLRHWQLLGPFEGTRDTGFPGSFPPEKGIDPDGAYRGKSDAPLRWKLYTTPDPYGLVDLNKVIGKHHGAVVYALAVVRSPAERAAEIRVGSANAVKIFLNGACLFGREEYHHGMRMDQHVGRGRLRAGRNEILLKICQNEQTEDWAQAWSFQLRVCDAIGIAVPLSEDRPDSRDKQEGRP